MHGFDLRIEIDIVVYNCVSGFQLLPRLYNMLGLTKPQSHAHSLRHYSSLAEITNACDLLVLTHISHHIMIIISQDIISRDSLGRIVQECYIGRACGLLVLTHVGG